MPNTKNELPIEKIKYLLDEGMRQLDVALLFNTSQSTISRIYSAPDNSFKKPEKEPWLCTCCKKRKIAKGNRCLCAVCFSNETVEEHMAWA